MEIKIPSMLKWLDDSEMSNSAERDGPEVRSLAQSLICHIVRGETEAVDF